MSYKRNNLIRLVMFLCCSFSISVSAFGQENSQRWKNFSLLDSPTQSRLNNFEQFFDECFQFPQEYKDASSSEKKNLERTWVKQLNGRDSDSANAAAAYLGMVRSKPAARFLQKAVFKKGGRFRWVCTRSLGQIRQKSSIPTLIELLDNQNTNTQVYARVSLAEITGVYFEKDKEKWTAWYEKSSGVKCTEDVCILPADSSQPNSKGSQKQIRFTLPDTYGRIVKSDDYLGTPTLYIFGACWCGGCQGDMEPFRKFINQHKAIGLQGVRVVVLDNELASLDFQKHYRLNCVQLLDTNRKFEKSHNPAGWTFLVLANSEGNVIYQTNNPKEDDYKSIYNLLKSNAKPTKIELTSRNGIYYMPATIVRNNKPEKVYRCERFGSIACAPNGKNYLVFTASDKNSCDILMRQYDGNQWSEDIPVANSDADEYDGSVLVDNTGKVWICWTSNAREKQYNVFITSLNNSGKVQPPYQLTHSDDDAMGPRMTCDNQGNLWVTYYRWQKRNGSSRDKEVYVRKLSHNKWSDEIQVSPTDVPWYEDHTEPAITPYKDGVMVAWNWDFHSPIERYSKYANSPTIFMRPVNAQMELGKAVSISSKNIDVTPTLIASGEQILCAWDSATRMKNLSYATVNPNQDANPKNIFQQETVSNVCTPCLTDSMDGTISLIWSETKNGSKWWLKHMSYQPNSQQWSTPTVILKDGNPRFPSAAYDSKGQLWIACSVETENGRKITVKTISKKELLKNK